jgi:nicotinamidase-related amidase
VKKLLVVVDMQVDFVDGALGTKEAVAIVPAVVSKVEEYMADNENQCDIIFTKDTHGEDYMATQEGKNLPVEHCIKGTAGWEIIPQLIEYAAKCPVLEKPTFGSMELADIIAKGGYEAIEFVGLCTDICVISNVMLAKAADVNAVVTVDSKACAGVTPDSHNNALDAMKMCQVRVL